MLVLKQKEVSLIKISLIGFKVYLVNNMNIHMVVFVNGLNLLELIMLMKMVNMKLVFQKVNIL